METCFSVEVHELSEIYSSTWGGGGGGLAVKRNQIS